MSEAYSSSSTDGGSEASASSGDSKASASSGPGPGRAERLNRRVGGLFVLLAFALGASYYVNANEREDQATCQARYNTAFATQLTERSRLSTASDDAKTDLLRGVGVALSLKPSTDPKAIEKRRVEFLGLFVAYDAATKKVEASRDATPLPPLPSC